MDLSERVVLLETRVRHLIRFVVVLGFFAATVATAAWYRPVQSDMVRTRGLIVVDEHGVERVVIGAPIPEPAGRRIAPSTGLVINDSAGAERFGVGLLGNGSVVMGFDAPPRPNDRANRERITIAVNSAGRGEIRFLDSKGMVRTHMSLFDDDNVQLFFTDYQPTATVVHRVNARGDSVIHHPKP
jgi:hypothetical protein